MKKALISPNESVSYISAWIPNPDPTSSQKYLPEITTIVDGVRVAEVVANGSEFPIAPPLFWDDCADDVVADKWYYNTETTAIIQIPAAPPYPSTGTTGTQTV